MRCIFSILLTLAILLNSCVAEHGLPEVPGDGTVVDPTVAFTVRVPGMHLPNASTRAMTQAKEEKIETIDLLLFRQDGTFFNQSFPANAFTQSGERVIFTIQLPAGTYDIVFLINARAILATSLSGVTDAWLKDDVLNRVVLEYTPTLWDGSHAIPMWGEITGLLIDNDIQSGVQPVDLIRMIARIDIQLSNAPNDNASDRFHLTNVYLVNQNNMGRVAPANADWDRAGVGGAVRITNPSIPTHVALEKIDQQGFAVTNGRTRTIYAFESLAGNASALEDTTALVLKGFFTDEHGNTDAMETYYRIDFMHPVTRTMMPLLRNHRYVVNIANVLTRGVSTFDEALISSENLRLGASIITVTDNDITQVHVFVGFVLGVSDNDILLNPGDVRRIKIYSNNPDGWDVSAIQFSGGNSTWLNGISTTTAHGVGATMLDISTPLGAQDWQTATVFLRSGRITKALRISRQGMFIPDPHNGWAGSNIYWDAQRKRLTFADVGVTSYQQHQGVYFQWGSLMGISAQVFSNFDEATIYLPSGGFGRANVDIVGEARLYLRWGDWRRPIDVVDNRNHAYLYEITDRFSGIGDICRHMTEMGWAPGRADGRKWRMPTSAEFEAAASYTQSGTWTAPATSWNGNRHGTDNHAAGVTKTTPNMPNVFFPASGFLNEDNGLLTRNNVRTQGRYWSSSPSGGATNAYALSFSSGSRTPNATLAREHGFPVRCVVE